jgi:hypothetical protein
MKYNTEIFFENLSRKFCPSKYDKNMSTLHEDISTFTISDTIILRMGNVSEKSCVKIKTHFMFTNFSPKKSNRL